MKAGRTVVAVTLITVGVLYLIAAAGDLDAGAVVRDWWPLVLVALGIAQYAIDKTAAFGSAVLILVGLMLLAFTTGLINGSLWSVVVPVVLVLGGLALLLPSRTGSAATDATSVAGFSAFGNRTLRATAVGLQDAELTVVVGGLVLDLTDATLAPDARIRVLAILGGCQILVPEGWIVQMSGVPLLGGWDNTTRQDAGAAAPVLRVRAIAVLAGVEVRHAVRWG